MYLTSPDSSRKMIVQTLCSSFSNQTPAIHDPRLVRMHACFWRLDFPMMMPLPSRTKVPIVTQANAERTRFAEQTHKRSFCLTPCLFISATVARTVGQLDDICLYGAAKASVDLHRKEGCRLTWFLGTFPFGELRTARMSVSSRLLQQGFYCRRSPHFLAYLRVY